MKLDRSGEVAVLDIDDGKANTIGDSWIDGISRAVDALEAQKPSALVVTGNDHFFCGRFNFGSLLWRSREQIQRFIGNYSEAMLRVFCLPFPVVAAIGASALGAGCAFALQADYRMMATGPGKIGLDELSLGLGLPAIAVETLRCQVPVASFATIALEGNAFGPAEALEVGLVDELVPTEELHRAATDRASELAQRPALAFAQIKRAARAPAVERVKARLADEAEWLDTWFAEGTQKLLREAAAKMKEWERNRA